MSVMGQFCKLIASWMRSDQIRVAPTTGRLLSLQVGDRFVLRDEAYVVQSREVDDVDSPEIVIYELGSSCGRRRLCVDVLQVHDVACGEMWDEVGNCQSVFDDDVAFV